MKIELTGEALLRLLREMDGQREVRPLHTLRLNVDGDSVMIKVNESTWTHPLTDGVQVT